MIGTVVLRPHQRQAVALVLRQLANHRGCLLADDVGRGKTFVALMVARRWRQPLVVVPAALRDTWHAAMRRANVSYPLLTHEALSRGGCPSFTPDGVIVDESHHFRNPGTARYSAIATVAASAELLLLSATPVQNSMNDLAAQLALFLGGAVAQLPLAQLAQHVIRVESDDAAAGLPAVAPPQWTQAATDDTEVLRAILALPPPPRALGAGDAGALRSLALVRAWGSSRAALSATLARRRQVATAIEQSLDAGRMPTLAELAAWRSPPGDALQLGFAALLVSQPACDARGTLRDAARREHEALNALVRLLRERQDVDVARADALMAIVRQHAPARVLAFTEYASTAKVYYGCLRGEPEVGLLTASDARIASGRITRQQLLARFAPAAHGCPEPPARERLRLVISTDVLSEGVNLQDASVVVHLDLPWNPARLAQRVGRVRRPHGARTVSSYLMAPPTDTELLLQVESRLRRKLTLARQIVGQGIPVVPFLTLAATLAETDLVDGRNAFAALQNRIATWREHGPDTTPCSTRRVVAATISATRGWLALADDGQLLAVVDGVSGDDAALLLAAATAADGPARASDDAELQCAEQELTALRARMGMLQECGASDFTSDVGQTVEHRVATLLHRAPRHERARYLSSAARLRQLLAHKLSLGTERALARLLACNTMLPDEWLQRALHVVGYLDNAAVPAPTTGLTVAIIIFGPGEAEGR